MNEAELEEHVRVLCLDLGILRFHVPDSRRMDAGLPDDVLIGPYGMLWRECKTQTGQLRTMQRVVRDALVDLGHDWAIWRPEDLLSGRIQRELIAISAMGQAA